MSRYYRNQNTPMAESPEIIQRHLRIRGLVQGVFFRASMVQQAQSFALQGWVRNRHDGSVEALVAGPRGPVEQLVRWAQAGPAKARVNAVEVTEPSATVTLAEGFVQLHTE